MIRIVRTYSISLGLLLTAPLSNALPIRGENGNYYEYVATPTTYLDSRANADSRSYLGRKGHLVTITSVAENEAVAELIRGRGSSWLGTTYSSAQNQWSWETGPEAGQAFWNGGHRGLGGSPVSGAYSNFWITNGEPDNVFDTDRANMPNPDGIYQGRWADGRQTSKTGFVVEYSDVQRASAIANPIFVTALNGTTYQISESFTETDGLFLSNGVFVRSDIQTASSILSASAAVDDLYTTNFVDIEDAASEMVDSAETARQIIRGAETLRTAAALALNIQTGSFDPAQFITDQFGSLTAEGLRTAYYEIGVGLAREGLEQLQLARKLRDQEIFVAQSNGQPVSIDVIARARSALEAGHKAVVLAGGYFQASIPGSASFAENLLLTVSDTLLSLVPPLPTGGPEELKIFLTASLDAYVISSDASEFFAVNEVLPELVTEAPTEFPEAFSSLARTYGMSNDGGDITFLDLNLDGTDDWVAGGDGDVRLDIKDGRTIITLTTGSPVSIELSVSTPIEPFQILFEGSFQSSDGYLQVLLNDIFLTSFNASDYLPNTDQLFSYFVFDSRFFGLGSANLKFLYNGPSNVSFDFYNATLRGFGSQSVAVPEPSVIVLLLVGLFMMSRCFARRESLAT